MRKATQPRTYSLDHEKRVRVSIYMPIEISSPTLIRPPLSRNKRILVTKKLVFRQVAPMMPQQGSALS